jgi:hypothetical protein
LPKHGSGFSANTKVTENTTQYIKNAAVIVIVVCLVVYNGRQLVYMDAIKLLCSISTADKAKT